MAEGFIFLHRQLSGHDMWLAEPFTRGQAWVDLLMLANHKPGYIRVQGVRIDVQRGEIGWSEVALAARWRWSRGKVRRFIQELECEQMLTKNRYSGQDKRNCLSTILNYDKYQDLKSADDTSDGTGDGQATDKRRSTNKNEKNEKKKDIESAKADSRGRAPQKPPCPYSEILGLYHELLPQLPSVQAFSESAKATMRARWNESPEHQNLGFWRRVFVTVSASDFLMGRKKEWQCPGLLWIIGPKNFAKIVNGHFRNTGPNTGSSLTDQNMRVAQEWANEGGTPQ